MEKDLSTLIAASKKVVKEYIQTRLSLLKVQVMEKLTHAMGLLFTIMTAALLIFLFIIFLGITLGIWIGTLTGSYALGFLIVTAFILLILIILLIFHRTFILTPLTNLMVKVLEDDAGGDDAETEKNISDAG